jgi:hypothetical protein
MHYAVLNRATTRVADTTEVSGRVTTGSIKYGLYAKKQSSLWRIGGLTVFDLLLAFAVSLATSGFALSAGANERKTAIITFDAPGLPFPCSFLARYLAKGSRRFAGKGARLTNLSLEN